MVMGCHQLDLAQAACVAGPLRLDRVGEFEGGLAVRLLLDGVAGRVPDGQGPVLEQFNNF